MSAPGSTHTAPEPTPEQAAAITARDSDVLCEAGAGTGKTRVLVERYCEAVETDGVGPEAILAFTFTERAAAELRTRIRRALTGRAAAAREAGDPGRAHLLATAARDTERAWVTTIHGFCRRLLASHPAAAGIDPRFRVLDESEAGRLRRRARDLAVEDVLAGGDAEATEVVAAYQGWRIGDMAVATYERLRSLGVSEPRLPRVPEPERRAKPKKDEPPELSPAERRAALAAHRTLDTVLVTFGRRYEQLKAERSGLDFADLELGALELLRASEAVGEAWRERFTHVLVDEFQDTNTVQLELVEALRGPGTRVFRVGDELQSIYRFRNADLAVFRAERERARADTGTQVLALTGNFRSRPDLVATVNTLGRAVVGEGYTPLAAALHPPAADEPVAELSLAVHEGKGKDHLGWHLYDDQLAPPRQMANKPAVVAEARLLARRLRELVDAGLHARGEIVVLLRAFTHVDAYEEALERAGLDPYVVGGRGYWSQQQVEDVLRLLSAVANPLDDEMLLGALVCPAVAASPDSLWLLRQAAGYGRHLWPVLARRFGAADGEPGEGEADWLERIPAADAAALERFCSILAGLRRAAPVLALDELCERTLTEFGYDLALLARRGGRGRMANVRKLLRLAREFEAHEGRDLRGFLAAAEELTHRDEREGLAATQPEEHDGVRVMTVHAAKGLEFEVVATPDMTRKLAAGESGGDVVIGSRPAPGEAERRFGLRLSPAASGSYAVWEHQDLCDEAVAEAAEEGGRLVHVAATRARSRLILSGVYKPADLEPTEPAANDSPLDRLLPALRELGWNGAPGRAELTLPPAPALGGESAHARATLAVTATAPSQAEARRLAERLEPPPAPVPEPGAPAPPLRRPPRTVPVGHLSYTALSDYERCAYRFFVERLLGVAEPRGSAAAAGEGAAQGDGRARSLGFGNAVHAALEAATREGEAPGDERLAALLAAEGVEDGETLARARAMVGGWLASPLRAELAGTALRAELPFALELGGAIVRGQIDLLAAGEAATVVDFKTDSTERTTLEGLARRYAAQRELYALAVATATGAERVRAAHVFLAAPDRPCVEEFDAARLAAARARLGELIGRIRAGEFEPTSEPDRAVCLGCPAAARLCPHPEWRPQRLGPDRPGPEDGAAAPEQLELI